MNTEGLMLRSEFVGAYVTALISTAVAAADIHLMWIGETGGHPYLAFGVAALSVILGVCMTSAALQTRQALRSFESIYGRQPYGGRETHARPDDAVRDIGGGPPHRPNASAIGATGKKNLNDGRNDARRLV